MRGVLYFLNDWGELGRALNGLLEDAEQSLADPDWQQGVGFISSELRMVGQRIRTLYAPPELEEIRQDFVQATLHWDWATVLFVEGIGELSLDKIGEGEAELARASECIQRAEDKLGAISESWGHDVQFH